MGKNYPEIAKDLTGAIKTLRTAIPDTMSAFTQLAETASADSVLDPKTKELLAIAIAITTRCDGCIAFHVKAALRHGATREEVAETVGMAVYMGGGPSMIYGAQTLEAYDQFVEKYQK
ncbi:MAG: carboxymuconolactone decarboxylase family protein [Terasakiella sp.]|uniref:carboxymuconolactone decarboxylase family protein n=1 Tax=unclassified Terasakiella TaxID=2614952 RepID=UPI003B00981B